MGVLEIIFVVCMLLWLFAALPIPSVAPYVWVHPLLAWICVAILGFFVFAGGAHRLVLLPAVLRWVS